MNDLSLVIKNKKIRSFIEKYPVKLTYKNGRHIYMFRRILEWSMHEGRWTGRVPMVS